MRELLVVVQARMSSSRFPGKVLAPFRGEPVLRHVLRAAECLAPISDIAVATSSHASDDPVAAYATAVGATVVRGPLDDVLERFRLAARQHSCRWVMRINADSPLLAPATLQRVFEARLSGDLDLVTTVHPRTFPAGQNAELIRSSALFELPDSELTVADREHVTAFYYRHAHRYAIHNVSSTNTVNIAEGMAIDTIEDLRRLERGGQS